MILQVELSEEQLVKIADLVAVKLRVGKSDAYTIKEAAQILKVDPTTVRRRVDAGLYPKIPNISPTRLSAAFIDKLVNPNPDV